MWHSIDGWLRSGNWAPTFQGVATLVGVFVALAAVLWQVRSSSKHIQDQMGAQRDAEREEQERQRRSLARAFLFEIEDFYYYYLKQGTSWGKLEASRIPHFAVKFRRWPFVMYQANAGRIGNFDDRTIKLIINFYVLAEDYQASAEEFVVSNDAARLEKDPSHLQEQVAVAVALLRKLKEVSPALERSAESVCASLSDVAGVPRQDLRVPLLDLQDEVQRKEKGREAEHGA